MPPLSYQGLNLEFSIQGLNLDQPLIKDCHRPASERQPQVVAKLGTAVVAWSPLSPEAWTFSSLDLI